MTQHTEFWPLARVLEISGISKSELYRLIRAEQFPASHGYTHSPKRRFWMSHEVKAWQERQIGAPLPVGEFDDLLG